MCIRDRLNKEVPQFDEHFVEQIKQLDGIKNIDVQKTVWAGIDFNENDLEGFMKIKYEDSKYKAKGQSYEQTIETLKGYAESGDYGCYITTLPDDRVLEEDVYKRQVLDSFSSERIKDEYIETTEHLLKGDYAFMCQYDDEPDFETVWSSIFDLDSLVIYRAEGDPRKKKFVTDNRLHDLIRRG